MIFLFVQSGFISYIKGTGVKITSEQYPDLHQRLIKCCDVIELKEIPEAYLLRTDFFNALATKFLGRHYVVLFTDVLDALEEQPGALNFYIGHELGHIHRKHLVRGWFIAPAMILPILGNALRRAQEYTCDRYGTVCCDNENDLCAALATIAAGDTRWKSLNKEAYLDQVKETSGFWMSFNELTSDYPWMTKRMATVLALKEGREIRHPSRHLLAKIFSIFIPRVGGAAIGWLISLMIVLALTGILAAIAIPTYHDYITSALYKSSIVEAAPIKLKISEYVLSNEAWPSSLTELAHPNETIEHAEGRYKISVYEEGVIGINVGKDLEGEDKWIVISPSIENNKITWDCYGENVKETLLPSSCRQK